MATDPGFAPAKVNLALHVTGRRPDGYHLLDSLVAFAAVGDRVTAEAAAGLTLRITGPMAAGLEAGEGNLVLRAARFLGGPGARIGLEKALPVASGIGGGSSDAAAALRVLARLWGLPLPSAAGCAALGADVPVCLDPRPRVMRGIGELLSDPVSLPEAWLVLANPGSGVPTAAVFAALERRENAPLPALPPVWRGAADLAGWLDRCRNDLEAPAMRIAPAVGRVLDALRRQPGCLIARMSGSGATCFGLFPSAAAAAEAARAVSSAEPAWWVRDAALLPA
jgi:4-diphosphocytidyl-2-C-methyl-D-erythritol kinase